MTSYPTVLGTAGHGASASQSWSSANGYYSNIGLGRCAMMDTSFASASYVNQIIRLSATISYLSWRVSEDFPTTLTLALHKNSSGTDLSVSISTSNTGWVTDSTDSVSVSNGDALSFVTKVNDDVPEYGGSFYCVSARLDAGTGGAQMLAAVGRAELSPTTMLQFVNFLGILGNGDHVESDLWFNSLAEGTWQNLACYLEANAFNVATTIHSRIGGGNGSMSVSISAVTSGYFEDITDSDHVNIGDKLDYGFAASEAGNSGTLSVIWIGSHFLAATTSLCMIGGAAPMSGSPFGTSHSSLFGGGNFFIPAERSTGLFPYALAASKFTNYVPTAGGAATFTLLINGSSSLSASCSQTDTGFITDTDSATVAVNDTCANQIVVTLGQLTWASATLLLNAS